MPWAGSHAGLMVDEDVALISQPGAILVTPVLLVAGHWQHLPVPILVAFPSLSVPVPALGSSGQGRFTPSMGWDAFCRISCLRAEMICSKCQLLPLCLGVALQGTAQQGQQCAVA